ncbi:hypothetical protein CSB37_01650 [bacterium DOLZORAL124_38_8]|nr:MAG: hypothetical protein CSB37_01650 [bacterium DOLZORAL124_38_8]
MKLHQRTLKNRLRIQAVELPGTNVVTTLILAGAGSRYETKDISGISHFLEHMFFKGAKKYATPASVAEAVDAFGGSFNAFTGKEYAGYYIKSGKSNFSKSLDVLSDMLIHSKFDTPEIDRERGVILEEMAMYQDMPVYQISWDFEQLVFGDQPLGRDQIGTKELIQTVTQAQFKEYMQSLYVGENMVVTVAGAVNEDSLDLVEQYFAEVSGHKATRKPFPFEDIATEKIMLRTKKTEQYHLSYGAIAPSEKDKNYPALKILSTILGGNMSSRMFQNVREKKGYCYSIRTSVDEYTDTGLISTNAGVRKEDVLKALEAIRAEYDAVREQGVTPAEFAKAQNYLLGKIELSTEDSESIAHHFAKEMLLYNSTEDFEDWENQLKAVTIEQVNALAADIFQPQNLRLAGIGQALEREAVEKFVQ